ncbi:hypothetical protein Hanom_Chr02g00154171 [Helianthus anomalus]
MELLTLMKVVGLFHCKTKYIRGLNILIQFKNKEERENFLLSYSACWTKWFAWIIWWDQTFVQSDRIAWVKIFCVPLQFRDPKVFSIIFKNIGRSLWPYDCLDEDKNIAYERACILVNHMSSINPEIEKTARQNLLLRSALKGKAIETTMNPLDT